ncbi:MAG: phosphatase PAP2 family protein [Pseudomonadota bacterium]
MNPPDQFFPLAPAPGLLARYSDWELRLALRLNQANHRRTVSGLFGLVSRLGDGVFWYVLMAVLLLYDGPAALGPVLLMVGAGLSCTLLYKWLKARTSRPRPCQRTPAIRLTTLPLDQFSFPSGHTLHAVCFTLLACAHYPALTPLLAPFAVLVAISRMILGLHWLSDVVAGASIGSLVAMAFLYGAGVPG